MPFFLRHYSVFADSIWIWDDDSRDGTRGMAFACPKVKLNDWPYPESGIDEDVFLKFAYDVYPNVAAEYDWVIWADPDEFIYHPDILGVLKECLVKYDVIKTHGFNMVGNGLPKDDGRQIWLISPLGVQAPTYSKPIVFNPQVKIRWSRGKHRIEELEGVASEKPLLKLLHYRYLGSQYTRIKNARNYERVGLATGDKNCAWSCAPDFKGEHSPEWADMIIPDGFNVLEADI